MQINFGVTLNESMADAVKITVIATGFQPESEPVPEKRSASGAIPVVRVRVPEPEQDPALVEATPAAPGTEPEPVVATDLTGTPSGSAAPQAGQPEIEQMLLPDADPEPEPLLDLDDLDTPAYLRQGKLAN